MDLLDFDSNSLYFEEPLNQEVQQCVDDAAAHYSEINEIQSHSENCLMRAYFLSPEHPVVLVALYRFFYYQHRLEDALQVAQRVLKLFAKKLDFPINWKDLTEQHISKHQGKDMTSVRFYLLALKGSAYLELRLGKEEIAVSRLNKILELDNEDRLGAKMLLKVAVYKELSAVD